jgi:putative ABC transport system permease protein
VRIVEGRMFRPGTSEIVAGRSIARACQGVDSGASLRFAGRDWTVVGRFDAGRSGFDSEIWGDAEQMADAGLPPPGVLDRRLPPGRQPACSTA